MTNKSKKQKTLKVVQYLHGAADSDEVVEEILEQRPELSREVAEELATEIVAELYEIEVTFRVTKEGKIVKKSAVV